MLFLSFLLPLAASKTLRATIFKDVGQTTISVSGTILITQASASDTATIAVSVSGLPPNTQHGYHIHNGVVTGNNCTTSGPHFNPLNKTHGAPTDTERHVGDLGNFQTDASGNANFQVQDSIVTLFGDIAVDTRRAIVIHADPDDLGRGTAANSKSTGNAGARLGCGNFETIADGGGSGKC